MLAHPPVWAQGKMHHPWALFREITQYAHRQDIKRFLHLVSKKFVEGPPIDICLLSWYGNYKVYMGRNVWGNSSLVAIELVYN